MAVWIWGGGRHRGHVEDTWVLPGSGSVVHTELERVLRSQDARADTLAEGPSLPREVQVLPIGEGKVQVLPTPLEMCKVGWGSGRELSPGARHCPGVTANRNLHEPLRATQSVTLGMSPAREQRAGRRQLSPGKVAERAFGPRGGSCPVPP